MSRAPADADQLPVTSARPFFRLTALVAGVALLTSRVMLLLHEFGGHAAPATLFGGRVTGWYLFLFAGGRVSYRIGELSTARRLVVTLGGIAVECVASALAFAVARRWRARETAAFCATAVGTVLLAHAGIYLARGAHYGFGDGAFLAQRLGAARVLPVVAAGTVAVVAAVAGGRQLARFAAAFFTGSPRRATAAVLLVFAAAGLVHGALALTEIRYFPDPAWVRVMESASLVAARDEVARRLAEARRRGETLPSAEEQAQLVVALERERRPWPLDPVLLLAVVAGLVVGVTRGARERRALEAKRADARADPPAPPSRRLLLAIGAGLGAVLALILVLRALAP